MIVVFASVALAQSLPETPTQKEESRLATEWGREYGHLDDYYFDYNQWEVTTPDHLDKVADWLMKHPDVQVIIEGYSDTTGSEQNNEKVSGLRAQEVYAFFLNKGLPPPQLSIKNRGQEQPFCLEKTAPCLHLNRRVHFDMKFPKDIPLVKEAVAPPPVMPQMEASPSDTSASSSPEAPSLPEKYYDLLMTKAATLINQGKFNQAEETLQTITASFSDDSRAYYYRGITKERQGDLLSAEKAYKKAMDLDPQQVTTHLALAALYYDQKKFLESLEILSRAERLAPQNGLILFHQGRAYQGLQQDEIAAPRFIRAALVEPSMFAPAHYHAGQSFKRIGLYEDAADAFSAILENTPDSPFTALAKTGLKEVKKLEQKERGWDVSIHTGLQFDDNVLLEPSDKSLTQVGESNEDIRAILYASGDYAWYQEAFWTSGIGLSLYQNNHGHLHRFDTGSYTPHFYLTRKDQGREARLDYLYQVVLLDQKGYLRRQSVRPSYRYAPRPEFSSDFYYEAQRKDFKPNSELSANSKRDGENHAFGTTARMFFDPLLIHAGYLFELENAEYADWDYKGHRLTVGASRRLPISVLGAINGDYGLKDYSHPNSLSRNGEAREDKTFNVSLRFSRPISPSKSLSFYYAFTRNHSNLAIFDYQRQIYSFQWGWRL
jgi:tetratricopeptide (TPR) repeat protein